MSGVDVRIRRRGVFFYTGKVWRDDALLFMSFGTRRQVTNAVTDWLIRKGLAS